MEWHLLWGIPQGSVLSLMLFNINMKLLNETMCTPGVGHHQNVIDTLLSKPGVLLSVLGQCLTAVVKWWREGEMKMNLDKWEVMLVTKALRSVLESVHSAC